MIQRYHADTIIKHEQGCLIYYQSHVDELSQYLKRLTEKDTQIDYLQKDNARLYFEIAAKDTEIKCLSAIINRQHDDCEHLKTKLESKKWEVQVLDREIKRLKEVLESIRFCSSGPHAASLAEDALKETT